MFIQDSGKIDLKSSTDKKQWPRTQYYFEIQVPRNLYKYIAINGKNRLLKLIDDGMLKVKPDDVLDIQKYKDQTSV